MLDRHNSSSYCPICGDEQHGYYARIWSIITIPAQLERVIIPARKITPNILEGKS